LPSGSSGVERGAHELDRLLVGRAGGQLAPLEQALGGGLVLRIELGAGRTTLTGR
jgi:hypothetical protein